MIAVIVIVLLVGAAAGLLYFNLYNIRDMAYDVLRGVPLIGNWVPEAEEEDRTPRVSAADLQNRVTLLERQVDSLTRERDTLRANNEGLQRETERLRGFEAEQEQFKRDQEVFHEMVYNENRADFWRWYQQINPDRAAEFAREAAGEARVSLEVRDHLNMIRGMEPRSVAAMFEILMDTNSDIVADTMRALPADDRAMIMDAIEVEKRAALARLLTPGGL